MKLIDKDAVVAAIKKKIRTEQGYSSGDAECGYRDFAREILSYLDTLEMKDVDLEKEIANQYESNYEEYLLYEEFADIAKHFFDLGLKAQKEE